MIAVNINSVVRSHAKSKRSVNLLQIQSFTKNDFFFKKVPRELKFESENQEYLTEHWHARQKQEKELRAVVSENKITLKII